MRSLNLTVPASSVRIENVYGSHSTRIWPGSTVLAVAHLEARAVDDRVALAIAALVVLHDERPGAVHDDHACRRAARCRPWPRPPAGPGSGPCRRACASSVDCSETRDAVPPMWNVRIVSCVPGSPIDCAAMTPTARPSSTSSPGREVAAVALGAAAAAARAGQHRTDADLLDAAFLDRRGLVLVDRRR